MHHFKIKILVLFTCILFLLLLLAGRQCYAQHNYKVSSYSLEDGLSQSTATTIAEDANGFLWIGTADGLCRYDGYIFKPYKHNAKDKTSILCNNNYTFYTDNEKKLWIVSYKGVSIYNSVHDNFSTVFAYDPGKITSSNSVYGEDKDNIWIGLCSYGLLKINKHTYKYEKEPLPGCMERPIYSWHKGFVDNGDIWVCCNESCYINNTASKTATTVNIGMAMDAIDLGSKDALIITPFTFEFVDKRSMVARSVFANADRSRSNICSHMKYSDSIIILSSPTGGLYYLNTKTRHVDAHITSLDSDNKDGPLFALCAYKDKSGNMWVGTTEEGIKKITFPYKNFQYCHSSMRNTGVRSIYADSRCIYAGNYGNGIDVFSKDTGFIKNISVSNQLPSLSNSVFNISSLDNDNLLFTGRTADGSADCMPVSCNIRTGKVKIAGETFLKGHCVSGNYREFLIKCGNGDLICNMEDKLLLIKKAGKGVTCEILHSFDGSMLTCGYTHNNTLLAGTINGAYYRKHNKWSKIDLTEKIDIKTICEDLQKNIWIGTNEGLIVIDSGMRKMIRYDESNQLNNEHIYGILCDSQGNIWFSHNRGLSVYMTEEKVFKHYAGYEGLQSAEFNANAFYKAPGGELYFGGIKGINFFYPHKLEANTSTPAVKITVINVSDKNLLSDTAAWMIKCIAVPYDHTSIAFEFTLPEFTNSAKNQYAYKMKGLDRGWINLGTSHSIRYTVLPAGDYTFMVKAANNEGRWGEPTTINIHVAAPFWRHWWFTFLFVCCITGMVLLVQRIRSRKQGRAANFQQKIQDERERISRDLHDNVGTQLSLLNMNLKSIMHPSRIITENERHKKMILAGEATQEIIETFRETIWALNKEEITLEEFSDKLKVFIHKQMLSHADVQVVFNDHKEAASTIIGPGEALHLFRICQEVVVNSIKHAASTRLEIKTDVVYGRYCITIKDNGVGFNKDDINNKTGLGLDNLKFRAEEIMCQLAIESIVGRGTMVSVQKR